MPRIPSSDATTSARMRNIRRAGTAPELAVRVVLRELGIRYRANVATLPGSPDLANVSGGWAIFVHGCFWHGHRGCKLYTIPKRNAALWTAKVDGNRRRDRRKVAALRRLGLRVVTVWQCQAKNPRLLQNRLAKLRKGIRDD